MEGGDLFASDSLWVEEAAKCSNAHWFLSAFWAIPEIRRGSPDVGIRSPESTAV